MSDRQMHPNSIANLRPFPRGVSGNPRGKNATAPSITRELMKLLAEPHIIEALTRAVVKHAINGDMRALTMIWDRTDGMLQQRVEVTQAMTYAELMMDVVRNDPELSAEVRARQLQIEQQEADARAAGPTADPAG